jgi:hypothetical protein
VSARKNNKTPPAKASERWYRGRTFALYSKPGPHPGGEDLFRRLCDLFDDYALVKGDEVGHAVGTVLLMLVHGASLARTRVELRYYLADMLRGAGENEMTGRVEAMVAARGAS